MNKDLRSRIHKKWLKFSAERDEHLKNNRPKSAAMVQKTVEVLAIKLDKGIV